MRNVGKNQFKNYLKAFTLQIVIKSDLRLYLFGCKFAPMLYLDYPTWDLVEIINEKSAQGGIIIVMIYYYLSFAYRNYN